jgi:hypothetical protein
MMALVVETLYEYVCVCVCMYVCMCVYIQGVPGGKVNILGGHSIGHSKQKTLYERVLFRMVSETELFDCKRQNC